MVHLRIVAPAESAERAAELLQASPSVSSVIVLPGAARKPESDVILCDVAREDASVIIYDLKELHIPETSSISVEHIDTQISAAAEAAELAFDGADLVPDEFNPKSHPLTSFISSPDFFSFFVAYIAGTAGMLSLTSAKSAALIGVLISVTTIPAAANIAVGSALGEWGEAGGAAAQLGLNLIAIVLAGIVTLHLQRRFYAARRRRHLRDPIRGSAGLPIGHSRSGSSAEREEQRERGGAER